MSLAAVLGNDDTNNIVDNALARVREEARLDAEPVLPPLEVLLPSRLRRRPLPESMVVVVPTPRPLPTAAAIVAEVAKQSSKSTTISTKRGSLRTRAVRWPVLLCGFVASVFAGAAFMYSPVGQRPEVQRTVTIAKTEAVHLYQATKHTAKSFAANAR